MGCQIDSLCSLALTENAEGTDAKVLRHPLHQLFHSVNPSNPSVRLSIYPSITASVRATTLCGKQIIITPVSYTHLTLPTKA